MAPTHINTAYVIDCPPRTDDRAGLVEDVGDLSMTYRLRKACCGSRKKLFFLFLAVFIVIVVAIVVPVYIVLTRGSTTRRFPTYKPKAKETLLYQSTSSPSHKTATVAPSHKKEPNVCNSLLCYNISRAISNQLDKSVDPCDDFYSYVCGGFFKEHKLSAEKTEITSFTILNKENLKVLRHALENDARYSQSLSITKTTKIYNSCIDTSAIELRDEYPLAQLIARYGGWSLTGFGTNLWSVEEKMGHVLKDLNVQTLLSVSVKTDLMDSSRHIIYFDGSSLGMSPSYYSLVKYFEIQEAYKTYMKTIVHLLGGTGSSANNRVEAIYDFEKKLARALVGNLYSEDLVETLQQYHRSGRSLLDLDKTIYDFCEETSFSEDFILGFLNTAFSNQAFAPLNSHESIFYGNEHVFHDIYKVYSRTSDGVVKDYIMWRVVDQYVLTMPRRFVDVKRKFMEAIAGPLEAERWSDCLEGMMTPMDMSLGRLFVDADFDEDTESTVRDMTRRVRKAFTDNLKTADWMDYLTKETAKAKADAMAEDVGYPPYIKDDAELDQHYSMLTVGDGFFENVVAMNKMMIQRQFGSLRLRVNKDKWLMGPTNINAYYSPQQNRIVILAGILRSPFYKKQYPKFINYGSLAMIIAHETTHGFDSRGRLFGKDGNVDDWWSTMAEENFEDRSQCLVDQYNDYEVFGQDIDGRQTLDENIADNGGIKLAYKAYRSWVRDNEVEQTLPNLGLSNDQLFFVGFAMPWCSLFSKKKALFQLEYDVHSYPKYRVIGPLSNFKNFSQAFNCPIGSTMNPYEKCAVW
ncbi:endothelin-converting enzyme homolog isoform X1 [Montipora foliosa]|uniref:endothelin-converting enzyme homolog isoform X1 n=1 Tax=Montipora foliosa TaxID=591990 RepID=UPI0035F1EF4F